jgi:hypothetical protein
VLLAAASSALCACAELPTPPPYPHVAGPGAAALLIDTHMEASWTATFSFHVHVDGFRLEKPPRPDSSKHTRKQRNALKEQRARFRLRLEPGNHEVVISGTISNAVFEPIVIRADVVSGRAYAIHLSREEGTAFSVRYEGWTDDESARWPRTRRVALGLL